MKNVKVNFSSMVGGVGAIGGGGGGVAEVWGLLPTANRWWSDAANIRPD